MPMSSFNPGLTRAFGALAVCALLATGQARAAPSTPQPACAAGDFPALTVLDCTGWSDGNLFQGGTGSTVSAELLSALQSLSSISPAFNGASFFNASSTYLDKQDLATDLGTLYGTVVFGLHYGNFPDNPDLIGNASVLLLVDAGSGLNLSSSSIPVSGLSDGAIFANGTPPSVPSPGPLALLGLGLVSLGLSRVRRVLPGH